MNEASSEKTGQWSITRRLTLLYAASSGVMLVAATAYLYWSLAENLEREDNAFLANSIQECRRLLLGRPGEEGLLAHEIQVEAAASQFIKYYVRLLDNEGQVLLETPRMSDVLPMSCFPPAIETTEVPRRGTVWKSARGEAYLVMSARARAITEETSSRILHVALDVSSDEGRA